MRKIEMIVYEGEDLKPEVRWTPSPLSSPVAHHEELWLWKYGDRARMSLTSTWSNAPQEASILLNIKDKPEKVTIYRGLKERAGLNIFSVHHFGQEEEYQTAITDTNNRLLINPEAGGTTR